METPDTAIRRAPRTYGRRREPDTPDAACAAGSSASSNQSSPAFSDSGRDVPPSSDYDTSLPLGDDDDADDTPDDDDRHVLGPRHDFDWKRKLQDIDAHFDDMDDAPPARGLESDSEEGPAEGRSRSTHGIGAGVDGAEDDEDVPLPRTLFRRSIKDDLAQIDRQFDSAEVTEPHKGDSVSLCADALDDPFGEPLPILREDTQPANISALDRRSTSPRHQQVARQRAAAHASGSEGEDSQDASPPPGTLHPIGTPKTASSPTPPTTDEMIKKSKGQGRQREESPVPADTDELPTVGPSKPGGRRKGKGKQAETQKRVKAPTKKEQLETQKTTARIKAEQTAALSKQNTRLPVSAMFEKLHAKAEGSFPSSRVRENISEGSSASDRIEQFSSPVHEQRASRPFVTRPSTLRGNTTRSRSITVEPQLPLTFVPAAGPSKPLPTPRDTQSQKNGAQAETIEIPDSDEELDDVATIIRKENKKREEDAERDKRRKMKLAVLEQQKRLEKPGAPEDDSDIEIVKDDMHVVARDEDEDRKASKARHARPSVGRKTQLTMAGRSSAALSPSKDSPLGRARTDLRALQTAAAPAFSVAARAGSRKGKGRAAPGVSSAALNRLLLQASAEENRRVTQEKEREFYRSKGAPRDQAPAQEDLHEVKKARMQELAQKGLLAAQRRDRAESDEEVLGDESDGEWTPAADEENNAQQEVGSDGDEENAHPIPDASQLSETQEEEQDNVPRKRGSRRLPMVIDSDQDDDDGPRPTGRILVPDSSQHLDSALRPMLSRHSSVSSFSERLEGGTDKENDARLMFDSGPDKENTVIASQEPVSSPFGSLRGRGFLSQETPAPAGQGQQRTPLGELPAEDDEDPFLDSPTRPPRSLRAADSREGTPGPSRPQGGPSQGFAAFFESSLRPEEEHPAKSKECALAPAVDIEGGFSQFFETTQQNTMSHPSMGHTPGASAFFTPGPSARKQAGSDMSFSLASVERPALRVDEERMRKADNLFEREQEVIAVLAAAADKRDEPSMFVNANGFLTQSASAPAWAAYSPAIASSSPAVPGSASLLKSALKPRQPLGTLALTMDPDQDSDSERPRRLHKRATTPDKLFHGSVSPSPERRRRIKAPDFKKKKLGKSAFVEGEAEESDEDAGYGFGITKRKDDEEEEDDEENDGILKELVDDAAMDEDTLNELRVLEKVQEHRALDDAADEKIARDAAEGKMRVKKRNQLLDFDEDESEDEDEDARRRRQRMTKKRRIEGDSLEKLANNPETQAFVQAYRAEIEDDNEEFAHLENDEMGLSFIGDNNLDEADEDEDEQESQEVVSAKNLQEELRRVARGEKVVKTIDTNDVDWYGEEDDMDAEDVRFKEVAAASKWGGVNAGTNAGQMEWEPIQQSHRDDSTHDISRQQKWARGEGSSRNAGTGRASAVTGIGKSVKAGGGSLTGRRTEQGSSRDKAPAKLGKAPSVLSAVSNRRNKFA